MASDIKFIWDNFHNELKGFILKKTRNVADTDDILQDVFIRIIHHIDKVNQSTNVRHYLFSMVRNAVNDHFKNKKPLVEATEMKDLLTEADEQNLNTAVAECCIKPFIKKLPAHYREALEISEFQNISQKELAIKLGISYSGAKSRVQRGKEKLKALLLECCPYKSDVYGNILNAEKNNCRCS